MTGPLFLKPSWMTSPVMAGAVWAWFSVIDQKLRSTGPISLTSHIFLERANGHTFRCDQRDRKVIHIGLPELDICPRFVLSNRQFQCFFFSFRQPAARMTAGIPFISGSCHNRTSAVSGNVIQESFKKGGSVMCSL